VVSALHFQHSRRLIVLCSCLCVLSADSSDIHLEENFTEVKTVHSTSPSTRWKRMLIIGLVTIGTIVGLTLLSLKLASTLQANQQSKDDNSPADVLPLLGANAWYVAKQPTYVHNLTLPVRLQWNENYGYCGSTSMIAASMYFGTYVSQYDNRYIASNATSQSKQSSQLLLGVNDYWAAHHHKLTNELWSYSDTNVQHFLTWVKSHVLQDHIVIIGVFENTAVFGSDAGDADYDHIVPVMGWGSNHPLTDPSYYADDVIYFSDNGLYTPDNPDVSVFTMSYPIGTFAQTRKNANSKTGGVYSVNGAPTKADPNFGIAITGIVDEHNDCLPIALTSNVNYESPEIKEGSNTRPTPMSMQITATVSGLTSGQAYNLYQYNNFDVVPSTGFNGHASSAIAKTPFTATGSTFSKTVTVMTNEYAIFRAVLQSAA
jgi:hypothetical protein